MRPGARRGDLQTKTTAILSHRSNNTSSAEHARIFSQSSTPRKEEASITPSPSCASCRRLDAKRNAVKVPGQRRCKQRANGARGQKRLVLTAEKGGSV